jgi:glycosyltransferase involved in cell wall biosynthesis
MSNNSMKISFILPCLNEERGLQLVIPEIVFIAKKNNLDYEIVLADNNSTDNSVETAKDLANNLNIASRLNIVIEKVQGYGSVYRTGFDNAKGDIFIMADSDGTYDFNNINNFLKKIDEGYDMVIGNRFSGKMEKKSMPFVNRYIGNPILSGLVRVIFGIKIKDIHSGMRCMKKDAYRKLNLKTNGMEFASEMIIKAAKNKIKITEVAINYRLRSGDSKLKKIRDGLRHLKFIFSNII